MKPTRHAVTCLALLLALAAALLLPARVAHGAATTCTAEQGQAFIDAGQYQHAISEFSCLIRAVPTGVDGYRGRIEAELLLGRYSDAVRDYTRVTAFVLPMHPDAEKTILDGYASRLAVDPQSAPALTGASFARWYFFDYPQALQLLVVRPDDVYGNLFRGSTSLLKGVATAQGMADLEHAIALAPTSADVRFIVADAYTYGQPDPQRAFAEATLALMWGLDTPRIHAIIASAYSAFGDLAAAAVHIKAHIDEVTTELVPTAPLAAGGSVAGDLVPGRTLEIPVIATAGHTISISTSSKDFSDTIAVLLSPDGTPVVGSDDAHGYLAAFDWVAQETGAYRLQVTSFEAVSTGKLVVTRG
jgi:tetratricopeptide (TPR) repeat protein